DKHINDNYGLEIISKTNHGYNYVYSNANSIKKECGRNEFYKNFISVTLRILPHTFCCY
ncbi:hypothetical protein ACF7OR_11785, partial [Staphylococcus aureus]